MTAQIKLNSRDVDHGSMAVLAAEGSVYQQRHAKAAEQVTALRQQIHELNRQLADRQQEADWAGTRARSFAAIVEAVCDANGWDAPTVDQPPLKETSSWPEIMPPTPSRSFRAVDSVPGTNTPEWADSPKAEGQLDAFLAEPQQDVAPEPPPADEDPPDDEPPPPVDGRTHAIPKLASDLAKKIKGGAAVALAVAWLMVLHLRPLITRQRPLWRRVGRAVWPAHNGRRIAKAVPS